MMEIGIDSLERGINSAIILKSQANVSKTLASQAVILLRGEMFLRWQVLLQANLLYAIN